MKKLNATAALRAICVAHGLEYDALDERASSSRDVFNIVINDDEDVEDADDALTIAVVLALGLLKKAGHSRGPAGF